MASLAALEKKLHDLPGDTFQVFTASKTPPTEDDIDAIAAKTGIPVPKALRGFLRRCSTTSRSPLRCGHA